MHLSSKVLIDTWGADFRKQKHETNCPVNQEIKTKVHLSTSPLFSETLSSFSEKPQDIVPAPRARGLLLAQSQPASQFPVESAIVEFYLAGLSENSTDLLIFAT